MDEQSPILKQIIARVPDCLRALGETEGAWTEMGRKEDERSDSKPKVHVHVLIEWCGCIVGLWDPKAREIVSHPGLRCTAAIYDWTDGGEF